MSLGFTEAGYQIVAAVDRDQWGCKTLSHNLTPSGTLVIQGDIEQLVIHGRVDVVVGGPPCQSFSLVGRAKINFLTREGKRERFIDDARNALYQHFVRIVHAVQPQFFVMENVPGIVSFDNGRIKEQILDDFEEIGFRTDVQTLNSADFGVPQIRKRAVFIGNRIDVENPLAKKTHIDPSNVQTTLDARIRGIRPFATVFDAISDLPAIQPGQGEDETLYPHVEYLTPFQRWAREGSVNLYNHVARWHSQRDRRLFKRLEEGEKLTDLPKSLRPYRWDIFADKIKKQRWNRPSSAIVAHMQKDGLMYVHPDREQARSFTPREAARIQSFRDRYRFLGPMTQQFRQIGNAVPPLAATAIALAIKPLLEQPQAPVVQYEISGGAIP